MVYLFFEDFIQYSLIILYFLLQTPPRSFPPPYSPNFFLFKFIFIKKFFLLTKFLFSLLKSQNYGNQVVLVDYNWQCGQPWNMVNLLSFHSIEKNWISLTQQLSIINSFLLEDGTSNLLLSSCWDFCLIWMCEGLLLVVIIFVNSYQQLICYVWKMPIPWSYQLPLFLRMFSHYFCICIWALRGEEWCRYSI